MSELKPVHTVGRNSSGRSSCVASASDGVNWPLRFYIPLRDTESRSFRRRRSKPRSLGRYCDKTAHRGTPPAPRRRQYRVGGVVLTWLAGVALDSPNHVGWSSHHFDAKTQKCLWDRTAAYHYTVFFVVVGMMSPLSVTVACYWRIFTHIRLVKHRILRTQFQARSKADRTRVKK